MAIIQDIRREANQNGRVGDSYRDGPYTRYVEVVGEDIVVTNSEAQEIHRNADLRGQNFVPRSIECERSGFDGQLIVTLFGFTPETDDSRKIVVKCAYPVEEPR